MHSKKIIYKIPLSVYRLFFIIAYLPFWISCNTQKSENDNYSINSVGRDHRVDTIYVGGLPELIDIEYYYNNEKISILPKDDTIQMKCTFNGPIKEIYKKGIFRIELDNDSLSYIKRIDNNTFELCVSSKVNHFNTAQEKETICFFQFFEIPNVIFKYYTYSETAPYDYTPDIGNMRCQNLK